MATFYGKSTDNAVLTSTGLITPGVPISILGGNSLLYNSNDRGISGSLELIRRMTLMASYSKSHGESITPTSVIRNSSTTEYMLLRYPYRKLYFTASYNRVLQGVITPGSPLHPQTSYNFGITRWFKAF